MLTKRRFDIRIARDRSQDAEFATIVFILLITVVSRIPRIDDFALNWDEVWSVWQTFGSAADIVRWTPPDWSPVYFLFIGFWHQIAGIQPLVLRYSSLLAYVIGIAFMYRAARRLCGRRAALPVTAAYAALGYGIFLSLFVRSYAFLLATTPLILWLTIRYFDRPSRRRGLVVAACGVLMWFLHYTAVFVFLLLGVLTLLKYGRAIWRWWLPGGIIVVAGIATVLTKPDVFETRTVYNATLPLPPLPEAIAQLYNWFAYPLLPLWIVLFIAATAAIILRRRLYGDTLALLLWFASPVLIYLFNARLGLFQDIRYLWWVVVGIALWIGLGLSLLPVILRRVALVMLIGIMFVPFSLNDLTLQHDYTSVDYVFGELNNYLRPGDVIFFDPNCGCIPNEVWDYYMRIHFPGGLPFVQSPDGYRRVWYVTIDWLADPTTKARVEEGRVAGKYFGPPDFLFRLYEAPPDSVGIPFENGMRFHGAEIERAATPDGVIYHEGETVKLRLWWSVDQPVALDYSVVTFVFGTSETAQTDAPPRPADAPSETSRWETEQYYIDEREITLPYPLNGGTYPIWLGVYFWQDQQRIAAPGVDDRGLLPIGQVLVHSW